MAFIKHGDASIINIINDKELCDRCGKKMIKRGNRYVCTCGYTKELSPDEQRTSN